MWIWTASSYPIPTGRPSNAPAASSRSLLSSRTDQPCTATSALAGTESHQPRLLDYEQRQQEEEGEGEEDEEEEEDDEDDEEEDDDELEQQEQQEHAQQQRQRRHSGFSRLSSSSRKRCRKQEEEQRAPAILGEGIGAGPVALGRGQDELTLATRRGQDLLARLPAAPCDMAGGGCRAAVCPRKLWRAAKRYRPAG